MRLFMTSGNNTHSWLHIRIGRWVSPAIWRWTVCMLAMFTCLSAGEAELSSNAQKIIETGLRSDAGLRAKYVQSLESGRNKVLASLKKELDSLTKAGKLEQAVAVKSYMEGLTIESWEASVNDTPVGGNGGYVANPDKVIARISVTSKDKFKAAKLEKGAMRFFTNPEHRMNVVDFDNEPEPPHFVQFAISQKASYTVNVLSDGTLYVFGDDCWAGKDLPEGVKWVESSSTVRHNLAPIFRKAVVRAGQRFKVEGYEMNILADIVGGSKAEEAP